MPIPLRRPAYETLTITQLCRQSGATQRALRYYEERGLLAPARRDQVRIYSRRDRVRLELILRGRRAGFTLAQIGELFDVYDREGRQAQHARALPMMRARLAALEIRRAELAEAIATLTDASARLAEDLQRHPATSAASPRRASAPVMPPSRLSAPEAVRAR